MLIWPTNDRNAPIIIVEWRLYADHVDDNPKNIVVFPNDIRDNTCNACDNKIRNVNAHETHTANLQSLIIGDHDIQRNNWSDSNQRITIEIQPVEQPAPVLAPNVQRTVKDAMVICGLKEEDAVIIAENVFQDDFATCMDKSITEVNDVLKTFESLTFQQGQIKLLPGQKNNIKAFVQWTRDEIRLNRNPALNDFLVKDAKNFIRRYKTHEKFIKNYKTLSEQAKPEKFTKESKWTDFRSSLINYLRLIPGRDGVPLSYIVSVNDNSDPKKNQDFLDNYVAMAPLEGESFKIDAAAVHTILMNLIVGHEEAEAMLQNISNERNGRAEFNILRAHFERIGIFANDKLKARNIIDILYYNGENPPHMWFAQFEQDLT